MESIVVSIIFIILSAVWMYLGIFEYGLWVPGVSAHTGFIPTIFSLLIMVFSIVRLINGIKAYKNTEHIKKERTAPKWSVVYSKVKPYLPFFFGIFCLFSLEIFGVFIALFLTSFLWIKFINKEKWVKSILISLIITLVIFGIFRLWLNIPFPRGIFGF